MLTDERLLRIDSVLENRLKGLTVLLEDLHKPQNMGACIRTAEAIGIQHIHVVEGETPFDPNPKITQGCHKWVDIHHHASTQLAIDELKASGYRVLATSPDATITLADVDFSDKVALCFGNEKDGVSDGLFELADATFKIPMTGFTRSFNISVTLGMCLLTGSEARRHSLGRNGDLDADEIAQLRSHWLRIGRKGSEQIIAALNGPTAGSTTS